MYVYSPIAFDERVNFGFNASGHCLVRVRMLHYLRVRLVYNHYAIAYAHAYNGVYTHAQGSDQARWNKKIYSLVESNCTIVSRLSAYSRSLSCLDRPTDCLVLILRLSSKMHGKSLQFDDYNHICKGFMTTDDVTEFPFKSLKFMDF